MTEKSYKCHKNVKKIKYKSEIMAKKSIPKWIKVKESCLQKTCLENVENKV